MRPKAARKSELAKSDLKAILSRTLSKERREFQRYTKVLAESFTTQVKIIAETLGETQQQLITIREQVKLIADSLVDVQKQLIALREMVVKNTEDIELIKEDIVSMKTDIQIIKHDLKRTVSRDEFAALERRVMLLESRARRA